MVHICWRGDSIAVETDGVVGLKAWCIDHKAIPVSYHVHIRNKCGKSIRITAAVARQPKQCVGCRRLLLLALKEIWK